MSLVHSLDARPDQTSGSYRAWSIAGDRHAALDLAWHSIAGHRAGERQHLLPFTEPSIAIRRRFAPDGTTLDWDFVIFRAQPDGGQYDPATGEELFAIRFAPEVMEGAYGLCAADFMGEDRPVPLAMSRYLDDATRFADRGEFTAAWAAMHDALCAARSEAEVDRIAHAAAIARRAGSGLGPARLAEQAGVSLRHMRRCFVDRLGLSPRALLRRQRLTKAMLEAERSERPLWAELAAEHSFSDQAHLVRECRGLTGKSPGEWHRSRKAMAVSFNT